MKIHENILLLPFAMNGLSIVVNAEKRLGTYYLVCLLFSVTCSLAPFEPSLFCSDTLILLKERRTLLRSLILPDVMNKFEHSLPSYIMLYKAL